MSMALRDVIPFMELLEEMRERKHHVRPFLVRELGAGRFSRSFCLSPVTTIRTTSNHLPLDRHKIHNGGHGFLPDPVCPPITAIAYFCLP
jgi:hypothetical protein